MHVLIENGAVADGPRFLPKSWRNVSDLDGFSAEELATFGWYAVDDPPAYDPMWQAPPVAEVLIDGQPGAYDVIVEWTTAARDIEAVRAEAVAAIKTEAKRRITAIAPDYRQANLTARAAEIALFEEKPYGPEIVAELTAGRAVWLAIKAIRDASDIGELAVLAAETAEDAAAAPAAVEWPA